MKKNYRGHPQGSSAIGIQAIIHYSDCSINKGQIWQAARFNMLLILAIRKNIIWRITLTEIPFRMRGWIINLWATVINLIQCNKTREPSERIGYWNAINHKSSVYLKKLLVPSGFWRNVVMRVNAKLFGRWFNSPTSLHLQSSVIWRIRFY